MPKDLEPEYLSPVSIEWALTNIDKFGDTDLLPVPFEFKAIMHDRVAIVAALSSYDIAKGSVNNNRKLLAPKPGTGFRMVTQLDPNDTIVFLSLIHEESSKLEDSRISEDHRVACSYRINILPDGQLFKAESGWKNFHAHSEELANSGTYNFILTADIADFYNQIYTHRIENGLEVALVSQNKSRIVEKILLEWSAQQSRGIPVGPYPSIILAEICLNDVDSYLIRKGYIFTRYVDDFRIFAKSKEEALRALHDLTAYLYTAHRLTLQGHKTKILSLSDFMEKELVDPEKEELRENIDRINEVLQEYRSGASLPPDLDEMPDEDSINEQDRRKIAIDTIAMLFDNLLLEEHLQLGLARYLLRRATVLRTKIIFDKVLNNFTRLQPVIRDVCQYLIKTGSAQDADRLTTVIKEFLSTSELKFLDYSLEWLCHLAILRAKPSLKFLFDICDQRKGDVADRNLALLAAELNYLDWVRERKESLRSYPSWIRRAIIKAGAILPPDEKRHWGNAICATSDPIDRAVARAYLLN